MQKKSANADLRTEKTSDVRRALHSKCKALDTPPQHWPNINRYLISAGSAVEKLSTRNSKLDIRSG